MVDIQDGVSPENLSTQSAQSDPVWPDTAGTRVVFLLDSRDRFEARTLEAWAREQSAPDLELTFVRLGTRQTDTRMSEALGQAWLSDDTPDAMPQIWFQPMRIAWFGVKRGLGGSIAQDVFLTGAIQPGYLRRRWIAAHEPERMRFICGAGAWTHDIHANYKQQPRARAQVTQWFTKWVQEQAYLVLELAERVARGNRYKIPRLLPHHVFADQQFQETIAEISKDSKQDITRVRSRAERYLREMAASQTPFSINVIAALYRTATRSSHEEDIDFLPEQLEQVASMVSDRPVIFLITHKSMLDTCAFSLVLFDNNLPIPLTFGGINLSTPGIGALARRGGIIFLRRSFQDNAIYKAVFRRYIDHLIEKRFSLLWALEGTRSRTGKLLPPRFGLFNYVIESILRTRLLNTTFVPVTVSYDQITEVEDYAIEQRGKSKKAEGMGWAIRFLRRGKPHGKIFVRFGNAVSLPQVANEADLTADMADPQRSELSQTMAFQTALRMNAATPITATSIITLILLASGSRALTLKELQILSRSAAILVRKRNIELVGHSNFKDDGAVLATLGQLRDTGIVSEHDDGEEPLFSIRPEQHHKAAYYRNTAIHHFLVDALVEMSLLMTAEDPGKQPVAMFVETAVRLRGVFKFEFYFSRKPQFREEVLQHANERFPGWEQAIEAGRPSVAAVMARRRPLVSHGVLRSFVDAYLVLAANLLRYGDAELGKSADFVTECLKLGKQRLLQARISSPESVSKTLYQTGLKLVEHRGLSDANSLESREAFEVLLKRSANALDEVARIAGQEFTR